jgi:hypothetical protein
MECPNHQGHLNTLVAIMQIIACVLMIASTAISAWLPTKRFRPVPIVSIRFWGMSFLLQPAYSHRPASSTSSTSDKAIGELWPGNWLAFRYASDGVELVIMAGSSSKFGKTRPGLRLSTLPEPQR